MKEDKLLLITHIADEDGITPVILSKLVYKNVNVILTNPQEVDTYVKENITKYDIIHITDLSITENYAKEIEQNEKYKNKIKIFDHHETALNLNRYSFAEVIVEENGKKECGASLYYKYLLKISKSKILRKNSTKGLIEQVRLVDTYDFKNEKEKTALNLDYLFSILGRENYIDYFTKYIKENENFTYTEKEKYLIKLQKDKVDNYIKQKEKEIIFANVDNHKVAIVYAESNRSLLGSKIVEKYDVDFAIIINISRSISYRGKGKVDLSKFAQIYSGGGHKDASGSPLPKDILEEITKKLFKKVTFIKEENKNE